MRAVFITITEETLTLLHRYDLFSAESCVVPARKRLLIRTDLAVAIPTGFYGRVASRSGLALKKGIDVGAGVIDPDYR